MVLPTIRGLFSAENSPLFVYLWRYGGRTVPPCVCPVGMAPIQCVLHFHNHFCINLSACEVVGYGILVVADVAYPII